jgi:hypothetical protein
LTMQVRVLRPLEGVLKKLSLEWLVKNEIFES